MEAVDEELAALVARQHGTIATWQLRSLGVSAPAITRLVRRRRLHRLHRGVYAVGHQELTRDGRFMAAVLAGGPQAVLSHQSAALHWGIHITSRTRIDVTVPRYRRRRPTIQFHESTLPCDELTSLNTVAVTTVTRTLFDLAAVLPAHRLEAAINQAEVNRLGDPVSLGELLERYPHRRGVAALRAILARNLVGTQRTRSPLEVRFLAFLDAHDLPRPTVTNERMEVGDHAVEPDCLWRRQRVIAELDGDRFHSTSRDRASDRQRDRVLAGAGWRVVRITWDDIHARGTSLASDLRRLLVR
jgi:hypothetical protein